MKKIILVVLISLSINGFAQNLVQNPGFEQYSVCPDAWMQIYLCQNWIAFREDPDYYNSCSFSNYISPPNCYFGYQYPHTGNAFVGFYIYFSPPNNYRELIGSQLITPFNIGEKYFISFYVNLGGQNQATIGSNKMGVKFSTVPFSISNPVAIDNTAHFYCNDIIDDTVKWTKISGSFIADSTYSYIIIGNFFDDSHTDTVNLAPNGNWWAYYYIDDVCVTTDSLFNENWTGVRQNKNESESEGINIFPNPCKSQINVKINTKLKEPTTISLLDATGKCVMQSQTTESELTFNTEKLAKGLYLLKVEKGEQVLLQKVIKE